MGMLGCVGSARSAAFGHQEPAIELQGETHTYSARLYIGSASKTQRLGNRMAESFPDRGRPFTSD